MPKYHMTRKESEITDKLEIEQLLTKGKYTVIAFCRNNEPYIVTLSYGYDAANNALYFHSAQKGLKLEFIRDNQDVCATIIDDKGYQKDNCSHSYSSLVFWGKMSIVESLEEKKHGLDVLLNHLEENPEPIKKRNIHNDQSYSRVTILKLEIGAISGKNGG